MDDMKLSSINGLREALAYTLPQINSNPSVAGYSPSQWVIGYQPSFPGDLLAEGLNPCHLDGSLSFEQQLEKRSAAKQALNKADADRRLRRALLRRYAGTNVVLEPGQTCFYWRDARHGDLVKIRWMGPAKVILREDDDSGKPSLYWISHGTQLLRCAPHHVRSDFRSADTVVGGLVEARRAVAELKSRGVTRFLDLNRVNKRSIEDVDEDEEADEGEDLGIVEPPMRRRRAGDTEPSSGALDLGNDGDLAEPEDYSPSIAPADDLPAVPPALPPAVLPAGNEIPDDDTIPTEPGEDTPVNVDDETEPGLEPSIPSSPTSTTRTRSPRGGPSAVPQLDPAVASLYERVDNEDFAARRLRIDRQETLGYGPQRGRSVPTAETQPYPATSTSSPTPAAPSENVETYSQTFPVEEVDSTILPSGWTVDAEGYFQLSDQQMDFWEVRAGCLIRHHVRPRFVLHKVKTDSEIPIEPSLLDPVRVTVAKFSDGSVEIINDDGKNVKAFPKTWTGMTVYQITGTARRELCMYANLPAKKVAKENRTKMMRTQKKVDKNGINEKTLTLDQRALFQEAKRKELRSFFENEVWQFDSVQNSEASRTLTGRMLLKWSKNEDGSPRAKARLIVRGYADVDALQGSLETSSPTTTRLSRSFLLSLTTMCGWKLWTSDISTAFLQGLPQERKLWVKLPAECLRLLGASEDTRMLLVKPVYGQLDAPRRWYLEAVRRLRSLGLRQHLLDPCTFLIYETDHEDPYQPGVPRPAVLGEDRLCGMICLHVDDMLGAGDPNSPVYQDVINRLQQMFSFREWKDGENLEYCGANIEKRPDGALRLHHSEYLKKVKPMTIAKHLGPESELSNQEVTALRGLLGALQWPAVQSSPHLQASTSIYSGSVSRGLVKTAQEANRLLKFAKDNADVGLTYAPLDLENVRIVTAFDASFGCRPDGSSQGGFVVMLAPRKILETEEGDYHILDWRSLKLPRIARSSLAAEAQAAACASDATEFACRYFEHLKSPTVPLRELLHMKSSLEPVLITDAKALFDSYHRESIVSWVTDRRISLEIRVVKEQMMSLGGTLRWVSSERQLADGLTKDSARQLLADRLRHARVKFLYDPEYTAAKKKPLAERLQSQGEGSKTRKKAKAEKNALTPIVEETEEYDTLKDYDMTENDMTVGLGTYVAYTDVPLKYVNVIGLSSASGRYEIPNVKANYRGGDLLRWVAVAMMIALGSNLESGNCGVLLASKDESIVYSGRILAMCATLALVIAAFLFGYLEGRRSCESALRDACERTHSAERTMSVWAIVVPTFEEQAATAVAAYDRQRQLINAQQIEITRNREALGEFVDLRQHAERVVRRALDEAEFHCDEECPMRCPIYLREDDGLWHLYPRCSTPTSPEPAEGSMTERAACPVCAQDWMTPYVPNREGTSLATAIEHFLEVSERTHGIW